MRRCLPTMFLAIGLTALGVGMGGCSSSASTTPNSTSKQTFCTLLVAFRASNLSLDAELTSSDPAALQAAVQRLVDQGKTLQERAPSDIKSDVDASAGFLVQLNALFAQYGYDLTKLAADPDAAERYAAINNAAVQASLDQIRAYGDTDCGVKTPATAVSGASTSLDTTTIIDTTSTSVAP